MRKAGKGPALHLEWLRRRVVLVGVVKVAGTAVRKTAETARKAAKTAVKPAETAVRTTETALRVAKTEVKDKHQIREASVPSHTSRRLRFTHHESCSLPRLFSPLLCSTACTPRRAINTT